MSGPRISLCVIAKDEEQIIRQCFQSVADLVHEIVLVDTGSQDQTIAIAHEFNAKVFSRAWDGDFSAPRNLSIEQATGDWILVLDADEAIDQQDHAKIKELVKRSNECFLLVQRHYSDDARVSGFLPCKGEHPQWERKYSGYSETSCVRLFPRDTRIEYRGRVHELVEHSIREHPEIKIVQSGIRIHHYGHVDGVREHRGKSDLYRNLGTKKIDEEPDNWQAFFELAVEYRAAGRYLDSAEMFKKAIKQNPGYLPAWTNLGYVLTEGGDMAGAEKALREATRIAPESAEAHCNLGVVYLRASAPRKACACFLRAIDLNPDYMNAICNLGDAYLQTGDERQATQCYQHVLKIMPKCVQAVEGLGRCYLGFGHYELAERQFLRALDLDGTRPATVFLISQIQRLTDRLEEAADSLKRFSQLIPESDPNRDLIRRGCQAQASQLERFAQRGR